jgi:hypothetical protein
MRYLCILLMVLGCGGAQRGETELRPLEERRARGIIEDAIVASGAAPERPRVIKVSGKDLTLDMAIGGGPYGVAYITRNEQQQLAGVLPKRNPESDQLQLVRGEDGAVVLIVWEVNYRFDQGTDHSATAVTAERKLKRDVSDFVLHVVKPGKGQ